MKVKRLTTNITIHLCLLVQFLGFPGSSGPFQVTIVESMLSLMVEVDGELSGGDPDIELEGSFSRSVMTDGPKNGFVSLCSIVVGALMERF